jgi:hypothetical protein
VSDPCIVTGWGTGLWGMTPWGGSLSATPGGPLPTVSPFDIFCVGPCGPMSVFTTYDGVHEDAVTGQLVTDPTTLDLVIGSGGSFPLGDARVHVDVAVPEVYTLEWTCKFETLPDNFGDVIHNHIFVGAADALGSCFGLFFSKIGLAYTGFVSFTGGGDMVLVSTVTSLPGSAGIISIDEYFTFRVAVNNLTGATFIYITKTSDLVSIGHQLRFILPAVRSLSCTIVPTDQVLFSVRGPEVATPEALSLDSVCLGTGALIPNIPPRADAGIDQAVRTCSIVQLDGTRSFDPEGATIAYQWRLINAPVGSMFMVDGNDGNTFPESTPTGFTNKLYSATLAALEATHPIQPGDVLVVGGNPYTIDVVGADIHGFYVRIQGFLLIDSLVKSPFKLLYQSGISNPTSAKPTFYPDVPGLFKFDLIVFDGSLFSEPSVALVSVTESPIPRGCIPDLTFLWGYLSDFWKLVDEKERIETLWSSIAQITASELLTLWQIDYSKSLRDVQRTFQRRWLHYDLMVRDPRHEVSSIRLLFGGVHSSDIPSVGLGSMDARTLVITIPLLGDYNFRFFATGNLTASQMAAQLQVFLKRIDLRFSVTAVTNRVSGDGRIRIDAPFGFTLSGGTALFLFTNAVNGLFIGGGFAVSTTVYQIDRSLKDEAIQENDLFVVGSKAYRVARVIDDPADPWPFQRVVLKDALPLSAPLTWTICSTVRSEWIDFAQSLVEKGDLATFEIIDNNTQEVAYQQIAINAACEAEGAIFAIDLVSIGQFFLDAARFTVRFYSILRSHYLPIDPLVVDIPTLQEKIKNTDDTAILRRNIDFFIEEFRGRPCIRFVTTTDTESRDVWQGETPNRMWAETTYLDNRPVIEGNFGIPAGFTLDDLAKLPDSLDYLSAVRGLWYAYFNGPTMFNIRAGTQILLGLPFAEEKSTIEEIRRDLLATQGRLLLRDVNDTEIVRSYTFPASLELEINPATGVPYAVGDTVEQFAPLVQGVEVLDYVKDPKWFEGYLNQGVFFEVEKFFKFLVRVDSDALNLSSLLFGQAFVRRIKPTYTYPLFVVLKKIGDTEVDVTDVIKYTGHLILNDGACFDGTMGMATSFDDPRAAGGGWRSTYDGDYDPSTVPVYPTSEPVYWGFDKNFMCPEDFILGTACVTFGGATLPRFDSIFAYDAPVYTSAAIFNDDAVGFIPAGPVGLQLAPNPMTIGTSGTLNKVEIIIETFANGSSPNYELVLKKNGVDVATIPFTITSSTPFIFVATVSIAVLVGDTVSARIRPAAGGSRIVSWPTVTVEVGVGVTWAYDTTLPAGTYCVYKVM